MKKILSCVLAIALVFSLMSMTVFAVEADVVDTTPSQDNNVIGTHGGPNGLANGVDSFPNTTGGADITVNFNDDDPNDTDGDGETDSTITNKYAIDITYAELVIDLTDIPSEQEVIVNGVPTPVTVNYVWSVDDHIYVAQYTDNADNVVTPDTTVANTNPITIANAFMITNHSDLAIWYAPALNLDANKVQSMNMYFTNDTTEVTTGNFMIRKATAGTFNEDGSVKTPGAEADGKYHNIVARPTTDWVITINNMTAAAVANGDVIASLVVTFSPSTLADATDYTA